jgi:membrane protein
LLKTIVKFTRCFYYNMVRNELFLRSAALTYYAVFSIFPLLILISSLLGFILEDPAKQQGVIDAIIDMIPAGAEIITDLLQDVISSRAVPSIIAIITLLWSATGFLRGLLSAIDLIHSKAYTYNSFIMRGIGVIIILLIVPALFLLLILAGLSSFIIQFLPVALPGYLTSMMNVLASDFAVFIMATMAFFLMMRYIPSRRPPTRIALISSAVTSLAWVTLGYGFSWYLSSGISDFNVVYGSIGAVMALMLYLFLTNVVILFGAQVNASLAHFQECATPYIEGFDDILRKLRLPLPEIDEKEQPPNKPTIAP